MIVSKFGGTSLADAPAIQRLAELVRDRVDERPVVVVSAVAGITDRLLELEGSSREAGRDGLGAILDRHRHLGLGLDLPPAVWDTIRREGAELGRWLEKRSESAWTEDERDWLASHGELWSSRIVAAALLRAGLPASWTDARLFMITDDRFTEATPDRPAIERRAPRFLGPLLCGRRIPVTQGFIGATAEGRTTTLGRGGSDYTASLLGAVLGADRVEIWTDVDGIMTADPRIVADARPLAEASYDEAAELAAFGTRMLHPATELPLIEARIPCVVRNAFAPERSGTRLVAERLDRTGNSGPVRSVALRRNVAVIRLQVPRRSSSTPRDGILRVCARHGVQAHILWSGEVSVSATVDGDPDLTCLTADLARLGRVTTHRRRAVVAIVGQGLGASPAFTRRLLDAVRQIDLEAISQGSSDTHVTLVVRDEDGPTTVRSLHAAFFGR